MVDDDIDGVEPPALVRCRNILRMNRLPSDIEHRCANHLTRRRVSRPQLDVFRESPMEQRDFLERVDGFRLVSCREIFGENGPKSLEIVALAHFDALVSAFVDGISTETLPLDGSLRNDGRRHVPTHQFRPTFQENREKIFIGRQAVENARNGLVNDATDALLTQKIVDFAEQHADFFRRGLGRHHQAAVSQSLMAVKRAVTLVGRQQRVERTVEIAEQRMVAESVGMIVHIAAVEEESSVLRLRHESVPFVGLIGGVSSDVKHFSRGR